MEGINKLSLVVPAYKQEKTIAKDVESLGDTLASLKIHYEMLKKK